MIHLDRLISTFNPSVTVAYSGGHTTWTLPFDVPTDNSEGTLVLVSGDDAVDTVGAVLTTVRPAANQIRVENQNLSIFEMFAGVLYEMDVELSTLYPRKDITNGPAIAETRGKLQLRWVEFDLSGTDNFVVTVSQPERTDIAYTASADELSEGLVRVPLLGRNSHTTIALSSLSALGCRINGVNWEGFLHTRNFPR